MTPQFKVDNWVINKTRDSIYKLQFEDIIRFEDNDIELWQPKVGEWCWFIDSTKNRISFVEYRGFENEEYYGIDAQYHDMVYSRVVEPFIGTLPSSIKDKQ